MAPRKPKSLVEVVKAGEYRTSLEALRDRLAAELMSAEGSAVASLGRQLADVLKTLDSMTVPEVSVSDDIAAQRAKRRGAEVADASGGGQRRRSGGRRSSG